MKVFLATVLLTVVFTAAARQVLRNESAEPQISPHGDDEVDHGGGLNRQIKLKHQRIDCQTEGRFAAPDDCGQYYECVRGRNGDLIANRQSCFGLAYDASQEGCVALERAEWCIPDPTNSLRSYNVDDPNLQKLCNANQNQFFCLDCKTLIACLGKRPQIIPCNYGYTCYNDTNRFRGGVCYPRAPAECTCNSDDIFKSDLYDSSKFLTCGSQGAEPALMSCPEGLEFNQEYSSCGAPVNTTCLNSGTFVVQFDCTKYQTCTYTDAGSFFKSVFTCSDKTMYNEEIGKCENPCYWHSGNFTCEEEGRFPNPEDCTTYFECIKDPVDSKNFMKIKNACEEGYEWLPLGDVYHCMVKGTTKEECVSKKSNTCKVPKEWCIDKTVSTSSTTITTTTTTMTTTTTTPPPPFEIDFSNAKIGQTSYYNGDYTAEKAFLSTSPFYCSARGLPQAIWVSFAVPVPVVKYSFQGRTSSSLTVTDGPTKYVFFGSNSADCSDKSSWVHLVEDNSGTPFTKANTPKTELVPGNKRFTCYGFYVTAVGGRTDGPYVCIDNIKFYTTGLQELDLDNVGVGATSTCCNELPERAFLPASRNLFWQSAQGVFPQKPQSIWYQFPVPVVVTMFSFQSRPDGHVTDCGPSSYEVFGSNAADCSDQNSWVTLFEDHEIKPFTTANNPRSGNITNPEQYRCYGIKALTISSNYGSSLHNIRFFSLRY